MNSVITHWLPQLLLFEDFNSDWDKYLENLYSVFYSDFVKQGSYFKQKRVFTRYHPSHDNKGMTFWHLISEGRLESERIPDFRRCERIAWPKALLSCENNEEVKVWQTERRRKRMLEKRLVLALEDFSYVVVLAPHKEGYLLITAYLVEYANRRKKLKEEYERYQKEKKEGAPRVKRAPYSFHTW